MQAGGKNRGNCCRKEEGPVLRPVLWYKTVVKKMTHNPDFSRSRCGHIKKIMINAADYRLRLISSPSNSSTVVMIFELAWNPR